MTIKLVFVASPLSTQH